jgi:hypothetical protein
VNELLAKAGAFFLAPPAAPAMEPMVMAPAVSCAGVIAATSDLAAAAGAVAASLRRGARTAMVCADRPSRPAPLPATPAARAFARTLAGRDIAATANGTICHVAPPAEPLEFVRQAWRLLAFSEVPVVVAISRRDEVHDELLAALDLLVFAPPPGADAALTDLAVASLEQLGPPVTGITAPRGAILRRLAAAGLSRTGLPAVVPA